MSKGRKGEREANEDRPKPCFLKLSSFLQIIILLPDIVKQIIRVNSRRGDLGRGGRRSGSARSGREGRGVQGDEVEADKSGREGSRR